MFGDSYSRRISDLAGICWAQVLFLLVLLTSQAICPEMAHGATNPVPVINYATPNQAVAGVTIPMTMTGSGFVPGSVMLVNGVAVPTTYMSSTSVVAQVTAPAGSANNIAV